MLAVLDLHGFYKHIEINGPKPTVKVPVPLKLPSLWNTEENLKVPNLEVMTFIYSHRTEYGTLIYKPERNYLCGA